MTANPTSATDENPDASGRSSPQASFVTTHWSVVLAARESGSPASAEAMEQLCRDYWYPLYAYVRRRGHSPEDAQDLTQEFFAHLLKHNWVGGAERSKGRFRTFLLTAMSRFLANEWDRAQCQKRGGNAIHGPVDTAMAESRLQADAAANELAPDRLYDREWAITLLDRALTALGVEQTQAGRAREFEVLQPYLTAERGDIPYRTVADQLGASQTAARMAVHRLRKRFREVFCAQIAQTVASPEEVEEEIRHLLAALAR